MSKYLVGSENTEVRISAGNKVFLSADNPAGIAEGLYTPRQLQAEQRKYTRGGGREDLREYTTPTYKVEGGPVRVKSAEGKVLCAPVYSDTVVGEVPALEHAEHLQAILPGAWCVPQAEGRLVGSLSSLLAAIREGRIREGYTLVDSLQGRGGVHLQASALAAVETLVAQVASIYFAGGAGAVEVNRDEEGEVITTGSLQRAQETARDTSPNYRGVQPEDVAEALSQVVEGLVAHEVADTSREVLIYAEVTDPERWREVAEKSPLQAIGKLEPRVRDWCRRNASRQYPQGHRFAKTSVAVHGNTRARNLREVLVAIRGGKATCASQREETRVCRFLSVADLLPGVAVRVEEGERVLTWRGYVKLNTLRYLGKAADRQRFHEVASIDTLVAESEEHEYAECLVGDLAIICEGGDPVAEEALRRRGYYDTLQVAEAAVRRFGKLHRWRVEKVAGCLSILPLLLTGYSSVQIAAQRNLVLRTVQRRIVDLQAALKPVFLPEETEVAEHLSNLVEYAEEQYTNLATG